MPIDDVRLSRVTSHALRHQPARYGLALDGEGWVDVADLLAALRRHRREWAGLARVDLERMIARSDKPRFELQGERIRARYGHSVPVEAARSPVPPPELLYHGTTPEAAARILGDGLRPMRRQFVHLSADEPSARAVGRRRTPRPVVLTVRAGEAQAAGVRFYEGGPGIWLADHVPARFIGTGGEAGAPSPPGPGSAHGRTTASGGGAAAGPAGPD